jgi:hypothetical protein
MEPENLQELKYFIFVKMPVLCKENMRTSSIYVDRRPDTPNYKV